MFVVIAAILGAVFGGWRARARGGRRADILQYAAGHAILFALAGLFLTLITHRILS
ncbi:hypothetical protein [Pseudooceanicola aestuarii]|uniref:hypothetical protein n=1 Tax=Pseudooceanicola aestuarii TaxID=2697319 RepID=UPI0019544E0E|nr:hypothetical protein [Pseudooceanicola aestuarii]